MMSTVEFLAVLKEQIGASVLQESPYPVIAPTTVEAAAACVRAARDHHFNVLVLGSGSSFPPDFHVLRENLLALMTIRLTGTQRVNAFSTRVLAGTPVAAVVHGPKDGARKTLGGLLADTRDRAVDPVIRALWARATAVEVISASGELRRHLTATAGSPDDPGAAELFLGSRGRMGMITALEVSGPLPLELPESDGERRQGFAPERSEPPLTLKELQVELDPDGLFQWS
jgi:FAD/FMN-containing dehydrogenase